MELQIAFNILKKIREQIKDWEDGSLNDISENEIYSIIDLLRWFLELKYKIHMGTFNGKR